MNMKKIVGMAAILFALGTMTAAAQSTLREGVYQTQGSADEYYVNADYNYNRTRKGYYTLQGYAGSAKSKRVILVVSGTITGSELRTNVNKTDAKTFIAAAGEDTSNINLPPDGALLIYTIVESETFLDPSGQRWIWRRTRK